MSERLRLCYYGDPNSVHTRRWMNFFVQRGHQVHLINDSGMPVTIKGVTVHDSTISVRTPPFRWIQRWGKLQSLLRRKIRPHIFHVHYVTDYGYWGVLAFFHPFVLTPWGSDIFLAPKRSAFDQFFTRVALRSSDLITVESEALRGEVVKLGANPDKIHKIIWGVDFRALRGDAASLSQELNIPRDALVILSMRNLRPLYNHAFILRAAPKILEVLPKAQFLFVGSGEQKAELEGLARNLGVHRNVRILGEQPHDKVRDFMALADIYVSIPSSDSISTTLLEAMASGKPVIVSDIPANREWVTDKENGLVISPNERAIKEAVLTLASSPGLRKEFGQKNKEKVEQHADYESNMVEAEKLYFSLVK